LLLLLLIPSSSNCITTILLLLSYPPPEAIYRHISNALLIISWYLCITLQVEHERDRGKGER